MKFSRLSILFLILSFLMNEEDCYSQISQGGMPPSFLTPGLQDSVEVVQMPTVSVDSVIQHFP